MSYQSLQTLIMIEPSQTGTTDGKRLRDNSQLNNVYSNVMSGQILAESSHSVNTPIKYFAIYSCKNYTIL